MPAATRPRLILPTTAKQFVVTHFYTPIVGGSQGTLGAQLQEYFSARDELFRAIGDQHVALTFGTGALIATFGAGFVAWNRSAAPFVFIGVILLSWWIFTLWLGQVVRMLRAVAFCTEQEARINQSIPRDSLGFPALRWEEWRQDPGARWRTINWTYLSVGVVIAAVDLTAAGCMTATAHSNGWAAWELSVGLIAVASAAALFFLFVAKTFVTWAKEAVGLPNTRAIKFLLLILEKIRLSPPNASVRS
jgi:hypothetical protein